MLADAKEMLARFMAEKHGRPTFSRQVDVVIQMNNLPAQHLMIQIHLQNTKQCFEFKVKLN